MASSSIDDKFSTMNKCMELILRSPYMEKLWLIICLNYQLGSSDTGGTVSHLFIYSASPSDTALYEIWHCKYEIS